MAFKAVFVVLENLFTDEITRDGPGQRREEVLIAFGIPLDVPLTGILGLQGDHYQGEYRRDSRPPQTDPPLDSSTGQPVEDEEPDHDKGDKDMYPPDDRTCDLIAYVDDPLIFTGTTPVTSRMMGATRAAYPRYRSTFGRL